MTPEERFERIERNLDTLTAMTIQHAERMSEFEFAMEKLLSSQKQLLAAQVVLTDQHTRLDAKVAEQQIRLDAKVAEQQTRTDAKFAELAERLNILIGFVMREKS